MLAGYVGADPSRVSLRQLFTMAQGKREEERRYLLEQRWTIWGDSPATAGQYWRFLETGEFCGGDQRDPRAISPELQAKVREIEERMRANGGKLIVEE